MIYYDAQARRDCFLSGESSNVCTNHRLRWKILIGFNRFWLCSAPHPARVLSASLRLALTGPRRAYATAGGLACAAEPMGWGAITREGRVA